MEQGPEDSGSAQCPRGEPPERRRFLIRLTLGLAGAMGAALVTPVLGFLLWPLRRREEAVWRPVGRVEDFEVGATVKVVFTEPQPLEWAGPVGQTAAWLRREAREQFTAFSIYCTHTACPVRWVSGARLFLCPCHGGAFHADGSVAAGPPPKPLPRHEVRVREGRVEVRTQPLTLES